MNSPTIKSDPSPSPFLLCAAWIAPMTSPIISNGAILIQSGKIKSVGPRKQLASENAGVQQIDLGRQIVLPGLVNAHTHLELSLIKQPKFTGKPEFVQWIAGLIGQLPTDSAATRQLFAEGTKAGIEQSLRFGVTTVGDISRMCQVSRSVIKTSPIRAVSFGEITAMAQRRDRLEAQLAAAIDEQDVTDRLKIGITPHAPYSVERDGYLRCLDESKRLNLPLATHLAETPEEAEFIGRQTGPFAKLWEQMNAWDDRVPKFTGGPIRFAQFLGLLDHPTLLAHVNYCDDAEMKVLAGGRASVVYCPRTHQYFGHPPHRWREMISRGVNVALGTDSCASSPDLNLSDDLRLLHQIAPDLPAHELWKLATVNAAHALRMTGRIGCIDPGACADCIAFPAQTDQPLAEILESQIQPTRVFIGGEEIKL